MSRVRSSAFAAVVGGCIAITACQRSKESSGTSASSGSSPEQASGGKTSPWKLGTDATQWKADSSLLSELQDETAVGDFRIRPPRSFEASVTNPKGSATAGLYAWLPAETFDGAMHVDITQIDPYGGHADRTPHEVLEDQLKIESQLVYGGDLTHEAIQSGKVNGLGFHRCQFRASEKVGKHKYQGWYYVARDGKSEIQIDIAASDDKMLKLLESAALTVKK